jgi:hypothetical protein
MKTRKEESLIPAIILAGGLVIATTRADMVDEEAWLEKFNQAKKDNMEGGMQD